MTSNFKLVIMSSSLMLVKITHLLKSTTTQTVVNYMLNYEPNEQLNWTGLLDEEPQAALSFSLALTSTVCV